MYPRNLKPHPLHGKEVIMLMDLSLWILESIYGRTDVCIVIDFFKIVTGFSTFTTTHVYDFVIMLFVTVLEVWSNI